MTAGTSGQGPVLVGITGGMGSGKSTVSRFWASFMGLPRIDIDGVCRFLLEKEMPGWLALRSLLPPSFFSGNGALDRGRLRAALFADSGLRRELNALLHPLALERMREMTGRLQEAMALVDVPLLFEAGWQDCFAARVVVYAEPAVCRRRLMARDQISSEEAVRSMAAQLPLTEKALLAGHVIDNSGCWLFSRLQVTHLAGTLASAFHLPAAGDNRVPTE